MISLSHLKRFKWKIISFKDETTKEWRNEEWKREKKEKWKVFKCGFEIYTMAYFQRFSYHDSILIKLK